MITKTLIIIIGIALIGSSPATGDEAGGASMQFLNIGARNSGTGGALAALIEGPASTYYDQAGMAPGAGLNILNHSLDYVYNANTSFGGTQQVSFALKLGQTIDKSSRIETPPNPQRADATRSEDSQARKGKRSYIVCAAKYSARSDAEKHIETLKKFGYHPRLLARAANDFRVVLARAGKISQAEKLKTDFAKKGINCFIEEE